jgi:para-nitrobenzyl esterase
MDPVVETAAGRLRGTERKGIRLFRGIPYARAPVGRLRFRPPEPASPWRGVRDALRTGPAAPQPQPLQAFLRPILRGGAGAHAEDCLFLNVWTPGCDEARRPVLVWLHGGAFVFGSGSTVLYSGRRLARRGDAVVVTVNYRLGALGFLHLADRLGSDELFASNLGLLDQIAALEWVRENIAAFGGDPGNVTLFGESAGAMSVGALLGSPRARPLFRRAILQSGAAQHVSSPERAGAVAEFFLHEAGLDPGRAERLRRMPVEAILAAQQRAALRYGFAEGQLPWQPVVDGRLIPVPPLEALRRGAAKDIPVLVGTNRDEWKLFTLADRAAHRLDDAGLRWRLAHELRRFGAGERVERVIEAYRQAPSRRGTTPFELFSAFQTDRIFRWPAIRLAEAQAESGARSFAYLFTWTPPLFAGRVGACHGLEVPFVFGTIRHPALRPLLGSTQSARGVARAMQEAWTSFARGGIPSCHDLGAWPGYDRTRRTTVLLGARRFAEDAPLDVERQLFESEGIE